MTAVVPDTGRRLAHAQPRIGLVLGAGGLLGAAWMTGALPSLQERLGCALGDVDVVIGTSAGSVLAAVLRCGVGVGDMIAYARGRGIGVLGAPGLPTVSDGSLPPIPQFRLGSPPLVLTALLAPYRVHPRVAVAALMPRGRGDHAGLRALIHALHGHASQQAAPREPHWVDDRTWIVAVDYGSGKRVIFGREGAPRAALPDAVVASCSIPGWYRPAEIGGRWYVDGGVRSLTSLGLMATAGVDEVYVLAPMASTLIGHPRRPQEQIERTIRGLFTRSLLREAHALRSHGIRVTVLTPGPEDLAVMGVNPMDARRREVVLDTSLRTSPGSLACAAALS